MLGIWWWAVFVVLHIDAENRNSLQRTKAIKDILARNVHKLCNRKARTFNAIEVRKFLTEKLRIPIEWLHEAMAWYSCSKLNREQQVWYLLHSGDTFEHMETAHTITLTHLAPNMLLNGDFDQLASYFGLLHTKKDLLRDWRVRGKVYFDYLDVVTKHLDLVLRKAKSAESFSSTEFISSLENLHVRLGMLSDGLAQWKFETLESDKSARATECTCIEEMGTNITRGLLSVKKLLDVNRAAGSKSTTSALDVGAKLHELKLPANYRLQMLQSITASHLHGMMALRQLENAEAAKHPQAHLEEEDIFPIPPEHPSIPTPWTSQPPLPSQSSTQLPQRPQAQKRPRGVLQLPETDQRPDVLDISSDSTVSSGSTSGTSEDEGEEEDDMSWANVGEDEEQHNRKDEDEDEDDIFPTSDDDDKPAVPTTTTTTLHNRVQSQKPPQSRLVNKMMFVEKEEDYDDIFGEENNAKHQGLDNDENEEEVVEMTDQQPKEEEVKGNGVGDGDEDWDLE